MTATLPKPEARPDDTEARLEALDGIVRLQGAIISELAESNAELRQAAGLDPPLPTINATTPWRSIKQICHATGFSQTQIRKLISQKKIVAVLRGGRWFVDTSAPMPRKRDCAVW